MKDNFSQCVKHILDMEGGFVNHPKDPGGATNLGITKETLENFLGRAVTIDEVKKLKVSTAQKIYKKRYWDVIMGDNLPIGIDLCVFDAAVNSGPKTAMKWLQNIIGANEDGIIGEKTLSALEDYIDWEIFRKSMEIVKKYSEKRSSYLKILKTYGTFGKGWGARVQKTNSLSCYMIDRHRNQIWERMGR